MANNYPSGINDLVLKGVPVEIPHPGQVFWVNSTTVLAEGGIGSSDSGLGSYQQPFSTIDYAVERCKANRGDIIYVMPGHVETISAAASLDLDVAGISVIGLGRGSKQCQLDFTATGSTVEVNADNVAIVNMNFHANISAVAIGLSILTLATDCLVKDCKFDVETTTTDEFLISINAGVGCDGLIVEDCIIDMGLGGAATGVKLVGATAGANIRRNRIVGDYSLACIGGLTTASTEVYIEDNLLIQGNSENVGAVAVLSMVAASTGMFRDNTCYCNVASGVLQLVSTGMFFSNNWQGEDKGSAATASPAGGTFPAGVSITGFADD